MKSIPEGPNPGGYCMCGCGELAPVALSNNCGLVKGRPVRYIRGHIRRKSLPPQPSTPQLCACGCGLPAPISVKTRTKQGLFRGQPARFILGHAARTRVITDPEERFWKKIDKSPSPGGCWLWVGPVNGGGYGAIGVNGAPILAHRYSYQLCIGAIPNNLWVLHKCDTPRCCNPAHLFLGTAADNTADMMRKGRCRKRK